MAERVTAAEVQRDRRAGALHLVVVVVGDGADVLRHREAQPAGWLDRAGQHVGEGGSALLAAGKGHHERGQLVLEASQVVRTAARQHHHDRFAGCDHGLEQLLLDTRQVERVGVGPLAHRAGLEQARQVPDAQDHDVRGARALDGRRNEIQSSRHRRGLRERRALLDVAREHGGAVLALLDDVAAPGIRDPLGAEDRLERGPGRHDLCGGLARVVQDQVHRKAVAAEERQRVVRCRADHGDALAARRVERQHSVVLQHDHRLARHLARQLRRCRAPGARSLPRRRRAVPAARGGASPSGSAAPPRRSSRSRRGRASAPRPGATHIRPRAARCPGRRRTRAPPPPRGPGRGCGAGRAG